MNGALMALITSAGIALVITAATKPGRKSPAVIDSLSLGGARLEEAALGETVH